MYLGQTQIRSLSCLSVYYSFLYAFYHKAFLFNVFILESPIDPGDTQIIHYLIATWAKVCQAMGPEFEPYLPVVMPSLLLTASAKLTYQSTVCVMDLIIGCVLMSSGVL